MCMLLLTAILVASEAVAASKWPRRPHMTSDLNSLTSITYVGMSFWLVNATKFNFTVEEGGQRGHVDLRASPQVKTCNRLLKRKLTMSDKKKEYSFGRVLNFFCRTRAFMTYEYAKFFPQPQMRLLLSVWNGPREEYSSSEWLTLESCGRRCQCYWDASLCNRRSTWRSRRGSPCPVSVMRKKGIWKRSRILNF